MEFKGYTIRAGSEVIPLVHAVHMNPEFWTDPEVFRPSRFLTADGNFVKPNAFIPFGIGKRMCLGETLARMEIYLIFSAMMHTFKLRLPAGASLPSLVGNEGVTISPDPFQVCCILRDIPCNSIRKVGSYWMFSAFQNTSTVVVPIATYKWDLQVEHIDYRAFPYKQMS